MSDTLLAAPLAEPIHLDAARTHLRAPSGDTTQDLLIAQAIRAARRHAETFCRRALVRQQRLLVLDCFPAEIEIPVGPLRAVQSIQYVDTAGATQTLAASAYRVDRYSERARIEPAYGTVWPATQGIVNAVLVKYTAGYAVPITAADATANTVTAAGHDLATDDPVQLSNSGGAVYAGLTIPLNYFAIATDANTLQFSLTAGGAAVDITSASGTGTSFVGTVPDEIVWAMLLIIGHLYEHREENADFEVFEMPMRAETLMSPYRTSRF